jgi:primosomal protein N' (replication factor Y)
MPLIQQVVHNDYASVYRSLVTERRQFQYPPFYHLIYVFLKHRTDHVVETASIEMVSLLRQWFGARVFGPDKPVVSKVKSLSIRKLVLKFELGIKMSDVRKYLALAQQQMLQNKRYSSLQIYYDVDPL